MLKLVFWSSVDKILIPIGANNPIFYNIATADYTNIIVKNNIWKKI